MISYDFVLFLYDFLLFLYDFLFVFRRYRLCFFYDGESRDSSRWWWNAEGSEKDVFFSCLSPNLRPSGECCRWFSAPPFLTTHNTFTTCTMHGDHRDKERGDEGDRYRSLGKWLGSLKEDRARPLFISILDESSWIWDGYEYEMDTEYVIFIRWVLVNRLSSFHQIMNANRYLTLLRFYFTLLFLDRGK